MAKAASTIPKAKIALWKKPAVLKKTFAASHAYIATLKPKPTTRKKTSKKKTTRR